MITRIIVSFPLWFLCTSCFAQDYQQAIIDSLKKELSTSQVDTSNALTMVELVNQYKFTNVDSALYYSQKALTLSRKIKFPYGEFRSLFMMGFALGLAENHPRSMELELKALRIAEKYNFTTGRGEVLNRLGVIYRETKDFPKSLVYHRLAKQLFDSSHNYAMSATAQVYLGKTYFAMGQIDSASVYALIADENIRRYHAEFMNCANLQSLARIQARKGNLQLAISYYQQSLASGYSSLQYFYNVASNLEIASLYQKTGQADSCVVYAKRALNDAQKSSVGSSIADAALFLSAFYEKSDLETALQYQKMALAATQKVNSFDNSNAIQNQVAFDDEERQYELDTAQEAYRSRVKLYALLIGSTIFLLIAFVLYRNNRQKQKANTLLHYQKEEINTQKVIAEKALADLKSAQAQLIQSEKMASLGELTAGIAHEIQNPLNFVNNFSDVNKELVDELKSELAVGNLHSANEIADNLKENEEKINHHGKRADSIVKGMLQHSRTSSGQKEMTDVNTLCDEYLRLAYHGLRAKDKNFNAKLETEFDSSIGKINIVPQEIGRVLLNLINNAFYAVREKAKLLAASYEPLVTVSTRKLDKRIEIKVADNGDGIPKNVIGKIFQPFFTTKPTGEGTGLGLSLVYDIVKTHGGEINVETKEGDGSQFIIQFPITSNT